MYSLLSCLGTSVFGFLNAMVRVWMWWVVRAVVLDARRGRLRCLRTREKVGMSMYSDRMGYMKDRNITVCKKRSRECISNLKAPDDDGGEASR